MSATRLGLVVRKFSTSPAVSQMVHPPIQVFGLEGRYAHALYSAATKQKHLEAVEKDLLSFQSNIKADPILKELIENPTIKRNLKAEAMKQIAAKTNYSPSTSNFLQLLAENGRLKKLNSMIQAFKVIMAAHRGEVTCEVTTAKPLDPADKTNLENVLKTFVQANEKILLTTKVNPAILGGLIVVVGDRYVDMSIASKIKKYTDLISASA